MNDWRAEERGREEEGLGGAGSTETKTGTPYLRCGEKVTQKSKNVIEDVAVGPN